MVSWGKSKRGWNCDQINADGTRTCRRTTVTKENEVVATGTEVTIGVDEKCRPIFSGNPQNILDNDDQAIGSIAEKMTSQCKRERGL